MKVAGLVYPGLGLLDFAGPPRYLAMGRARRFAWLHRRPKPWLPNGHTAYLAAGYTLAAVPLPNVLVVPGAPQEVVAGGCRNPAALAFWVGNAFGRRYITPGSLSAQAPGYLQSLPRLPRTTLTARF